jgi:hypothetical protein
LSLPTPAGPLVDLLRIEGNKFGHAAWHTFVIEPRERGRDAGRWCNDNLKGQWTFRVDFVKVTFYIKDKQDAMTFKLRWGGQ